MSPHKPECSFRATILADSEITVMVIKYTVTDVGNDGSGCGVYINAVGYLEYPINLTLWVDNARQSHAEYVICVEYSSMYYYLIDRCCCVVDCSHHINTSFHNYEGISLSLIPHM
jgi:hypothetical protein